MTYLRRTGGGSLLRPLRALKSLVVGACKVTVQRIFPATNGPVASAVDANRYSLGVEFYVSKPVQLTAYYFWIADAAQSHQPRTFSLWQSDGGDQGTFIGGSEINVSSYSDGAWNRFPVSIPPILQAGMRYRAVVFCDDVNGYAVTNNFWNADIVNGFLTAPSAANATAGDQGSFFQGTPMTYPFDSFNASNYWLDVEVNDAVDYSQQGGSIDQAYLISRGVI